MQPSFLTSLWPFRRWRLASKPEPQQENGGASHEQQSHGGKTRDLAAFPRPAVTQVPQQPATQDIVESRVKRCVTTSFQPCILLPASDTIDT